MAILPDCGLAPGLTHLCCGRAAMDEEGLAALVDRVEHHARALSLTTRRMPSGAGHDAQMMQRLCPTAMIFVPSVAGLSHNVKEHTEAADLAAGHHPVAFLQAGAHRGFAGGQHAKAQRALDRKSVV